MAASERTRTSFFLVLLAVTTLLVGAMLLPYATALTLAAALAFIFSPLYARLTSWLAGQESIAAMLTTIIALALVCVPVSILALQIFHEAGSLSAALAEGSSLVGRLESLVGQFAPGTNLNLSVYVKQVASAAAGSAGAIFSTTLETLVKFLLGILAFYYFLKDGHKLARAFVQLSPLADRDDKAILKQLSETVSSVMRGTVVVAVLQGIVAGLGYAIFGLPNAALWGSVTVLAALIPGIGTTLVVVPAILYFVLVGNWFGVIGLALWGGLLVGLMDNVLRPHLIGRGFNVHPYLILLSVLGGLGLFGPAGFMLGPLLLSLFFTLLDLYRAMFFAETV